MKENEEKGYTFITLIKRRRRKNLIGRQAQKGEREKEIEKMMISDRVH